MTHMNVDVDEIFADINNMISGIVSHLYQIPWK